MSEKNAVNRVKIDIDDLPLDLSFKTLSATTIIVDNKNIASNTNDQQLDHRINNTLFINNLAKSPTLSINLYNVNDEIEWEQEIKKKMRKLEKLIMRTHSSVYNDKKLCSVAIFWRKTVYYLSFENVQGST
ncbi:hypothetical protein PV325_007696 [Microctonus aethiopoides]|nr:hypothetical protein PV325_007696 [Microctonus aethiopoides]